ncbi:MAG: hypothetical protein ACREFR_11955 [Limisphaerales bacterium]
MNASETTHPLHRYLPETLVSGSVTEGLGALATIALAIVGLVGIYTNIVAAVATIVIGAVFLADSMLARAAINSLNAQGMRVTGGGMTASFFTGLAGIVLGIISFFHYSGQLISIAVLVYGGGLLLSGGMLARLNWLASGSPEAGNATLAGGENGNALMGLGVAVLGILAVIGLVPMTLALVGLLCLGAGAFFSGSGTAIHQAAH